MVAKMPYDILRDFQPIAQLTRGHLLLAVAPKSDIHSVKELIAEAKKNPGKLTNASSANGSPGHVGGELFKVMTGTEIVHVPYRGGAAAINDLIAGHVQLMFESLNSIAPHAQIRRGARPRGQRRAALAGVPGSADRRGSGRARLRRADLERHRRAGRDAARDRDAAQRGDQPRGLRRRPSSSASARSATSPPAARRRSSPRPSASSSPNGRTWCKRSGAKLE